MSATLGSPRLAISTVCLSGTLEDKLRAAAAAGFTGVEMLEYDLVMSPWSPRRVADEAAGLGLSIEVYQPFHVETVPPDLFPATLRHAERKFDLLSRARCERPGVLLVENRATDSTTTTWLRSSCTRWPAAPSSAGLRLAYEAVPWGRVRTHEDAWRIVQRVDHPALGLCLDSFHVLSIGNDPAVIAQMAGDKVFHVQLADAPRLNMDVREWSLHHRMFPGQGSLDVAGFLRQVLASGYAGPMALEVFNDVYQQEDPRHAATDAMRSMLALAEAVGTRGSAARCPARRRRRPATGSRARRLRVRRARCGRGVGAARLTRARPPSGSPTSGSIAPCRCSCGSRAELGSCSISPRSDRSPPPPHRSARSPSRAPTRPLRCRRAARLLAPKLPRPRRPDETDLSSVATPDGTALFFCDSDREHDWLRRLRSDRGIARPGPAARRDRSRVDHRVDRRLRPVRAVLPLRARPRPGRVHGDHRSVRPHPQLVGAAIPRGRVRITLSTTPLRRGDWAPGVSSPQLVAFATDDAIACAKVMRERGAPILEMPEQLLRRPRRPPVAAGRARSTSLRENSILYDRDEHGEFLHFFTEMLGSRVFFEVVQRIDGYRRLRRPPQHPAAHGRPPPPAAAHARERADRVRRRGPARLLARPPDRAEPVASGTGGCRRRRRLSLRGPADDQGHGGGAPLPADVRPGTHAGHQDAPRRDRHRGARHRARAIHVGRQPPRLSALPRGRCRARSSPRHHAAAGFGLLPQDRPIRRAVPAGPAARA